MSATISADSLSAMLASGLHISPESQQQQQQLQQPPQRQVFASVHYNHSAHAARPFSAPVPHPPASAADDSENALSDAGFPEAHAILLGHGISPARLFPTQIGLFAASRPRDRSRLIQLWTVAPLCAPNRALADRLPGWPPTSLEQEEYMARRRFEREFPGRQFPSCLQPQSVPASLARQPAQQDDDMMMDDEQDENVMADGNPEPYMLTGYNRATDPVYNCSPGAPMTMII